MGSPRHRRVERDGIVLIPRSGEGWDRPGPAELERDGIVLILRSGEGWSRPGTVEQRGMATS